MIWAHLSPAIKTLRKRALQLPRLDDSLFRISIILATVGSFVLSIIRILREPHHGFQWDLGVYYNAPLLLAHGENPYHDGGFVYSPIHLQIFRVLSSLFTYEQFYLVFLLAKILSLAILLVIWKRFFLKRTQLHVFLIFVWLGFYSPVFADLQAGNVSIFESMVLFLAFLCFLQQRLRWFVFLIVVTASIKITPIFFLILLLLVPNRYSVRYFAFGCMGFVAFALLNFIIFPDLTKDFILEAIKRTTNEPGPKNPSSLAFVSDILTSLAHFGLSPSPLLVNVTYLAVIIWIIWMSWRSRKFAKVVDEGSEDNHLFLILFLILVYTITMPRMKDYAYIIAIPSVLFAIEDFEISVPRWFLFLPLLVSHYYTMPPLARIFWNYYPLFVASVFWYFYLRELKKRELLQLDLLNTPIITKPANNAADV